MKISTKGRYGLRVMLELSLRYGSGPVMMSIIAKSQNISRKYLHSLLVGLKGIGLVRSVRGARGGYILAKPPSGILVSEVVEALEGSFAPVDCLKDPSVCERADLCAAREVWREMGDAIKNVLSSITLDQLAARQKAKQTQPIMYQI